MDAMKFNRVADLSDADRADVRSLSLAVYPPAEWADWPGQYLEWSAHEWCVRVWCQDGSLASYVGVVVRQALHEGQPVRVGGIGGVKTPPLTRGRGYARQGIERQGVLPRGSECGVRLAGVRSPPDRLL